MMFLICISIVSILLILWFKTEVWYEYTKLFRLGFLSNTQKYELEKHNDITLTYIQFLRKNYRQYFIIRMITCPICVSFWLSLLCGTLMWNLPTFLLTMVGGLIIYGLIIRLLDI